MLDARLLAPAVNATLEALLNTVIRYDAHGARCLQPLSGHVVLVHFEDLRLTLRLVLSTDRLLIERGEDDGADARITTRSLLWPLLKQPDTRTRLLHQGHARLEGDTELAESLLDCLGQLSMDKGAFVEHWLGTLPASLFTQLEQQAQRLLRRLADSGLQTVEEYLQYEAAVLPTREEYEVFARQVAETAAATEKLAAHIARLEQEIQP